MILQEGSSSLCFLGNKNHELSYLLTFPWTVNKIHGKKHCAGFTESAVHKLQQQLQPCSTHPGRVQVRNHLLLTELSPSYTRTNNSHGSCGSSHSPLKGESKIWHQTLGCNGSVCPVSRNTPDTFSATSQSPESNKFTWQRVFETSCIVKFSSCVQIKLFLSCDVNRNSPFFHKTHLHTTHIQW